jgi:hypothetical protein
MTWVVVSLAGVLLAGWAVSPFGLRRRRAAEAPAYGHFRCPGCKRRLRYLAQRAGHRGACPTCHRHVVFPATTPGRPVAAGLA